MLLGRDAECAHLDGLLAHVREGRSEVLVVRGEAGIGKSSLLDHLRTRADPLPVRAIRGIESEVEVPFSSLYDLVHPDLTRIEELPAAQADALAGALSLGPSTPVSRYAVAVATLTLLALVADPTGLVITVDDAQWLDTPTAEALAFTARRLDAEGVLLVFAVREGEPSALDAGGLPELRVEGLAGEAASALLARHGEVAPAVARRLLDAAGGNPLALRELPRSLSDVMLAGDAPLDGPLPIRREVEESFTRQAAMLPTATRWWLLLTAASETPSLATISAAGDNLGVGLDALGAAEQAGLLSVQEDGLEFRHPLLRSAIYQRASSADRRRAHRALADAVPPGQVDRRTWHLGRAAAGPDEAVAAALEAIALAARERAGPGVGARAFERAAQLTPGPDERARRLIEAARDHQLSGHPDTSADLLADALASTDDPAMCADVELLRARLQVWRGEPARAFAALCARAEAMSWADPGRAAALLTDAAVVAVMRGDYDAQVRTARSAVAAAVRAGSDDAVAAAEVVLAHGLTSTGRGAEAAAILRSRESGISGADTHSGAALLQLAGFTWMCLEDDHRARVILDRGIGSLREAGALGGLPFLLATRSMLDHRTGRWASAWADAWEAIRLAEQTGHRSEQPFYLVCLAAIEAGQGRDADCRAHLGTAAELVERFGVDSVLPRMAAAQGVLELGQGRYEQAIAALRQIPPLTRRMAIGRPTLVSWLPDMVEAFVRSGQQADARRTIDDLEHQAADIDRIWAQAVTARCRGLLATGDDVERHFDEALAWHEQVTAPFEMARTQLCMGEKLGLQRRRIDARRPLAAALATFERLGADPWAQRARAALARNGGRVQPAADPALGQLTPQELQIALAIADGAANKEAAAALFLSTKTIEFHLSNTYRKLGVRSRTELARLLSR